MVVHMLLQARGASRGARKKAADSDLIVAASSRSYCSAATPWPQPEVQRRGFWQGSVPLGSKWGFWQQFGAQHQRHTLSTRPTEARLAMCSSRSVGQDQGLRALSVCRNRPMTIPRAGIVHLGRLIPHLLRCVL